MSLFSLLIAAAFAAAPLAFEDGRRVSVKRVDGETTLIAERAGRVISRFTFDDFAVASRVDRLESFRAGRGDYLYAEFFNGYEGTTRMRSCWTAYVLSLSTRGELRLHDRLQYHCESTAGEPSRENPSFDVRYRLDRASARLVRY